jgi:hypothetical protein
MKQLNTLMVAGVDLVNIFAQNLFRLLIVIVAINVHRGLSRAKLLTLNAKALILAGWFNINSRHIRG